MFDVVSSLEHCLQAPAAAREEQSEFGGLHGAASGLEGATALKGHLLLLNGFGQGAGYRFWEVKTSPKKVTRRLLLLHMGIASGHTFCKMLVLVVRQPKERVCV